MHITHQGHLYKERTIANGDDFYVNYIVRKTPFEIALSCDGVSFFQKKLDCKLLYHGSDKTVESNSGPAIAYVCSPCDESPNSCVVSFRINVLSTQHANSLFTIKFSLENFVVFSEPIRAVSKPEQIRKKLAQCDGAADNRGVVDEKNKKRARSEELLEALASIQQSQQQQTNLITALLSQRNNTNSHIVSPSPRVLTFEENLDSLLDSFGPQVNDRPMKLARYYENLDPEKKSMLTKMSQFFISLSEPASPSGVFPADESRFSPFTPSGDFSSDLSSDDANVMGMEQETYQWFSSF
jgi:hypothetical protein